MCIYLCGHDQGTCTGIYCDISCHQTNILELLIQLTVFLVTESLTKHYKTNNNDKVLYNLWAIQFAVEWDAEKVWWQGFDKWNYVVITSNFPHFQRWQNLKSYPPRTLKCESPWKDVKKHIATGNRASCLWQWNNFNIKPWWPNFVKSHSTENHSM